MPRCGNCTGKRSFRETGKMNRQNTRRAGFFPILVLMFLISGSPGLPMEKTPVFGLVIHGGAGTITPGMMSPKQEQDYREKLRESLDAGYRVLKEGGSAVEAVAAAIRIMEDSPLFNAGKGAVFTREGRNELDASIMAGKNRDAGAVAGVTIVKNPILLARRVMEKSPHVLLAREGAEAFARQQGVEVVDPSYFFTQRRWDQLQKVLERDQEEYKFGTVGCCALDREGNLAAGTSTGGMTNKRWGRVGDSPIIGAGTWADNDTCAVSCTGHGEFFIRWAVAHDISAMMAYRGLSLQSAADRVIHGKLKTQGARGGVVAIDGQGNVAMPFNTPGMYRGYQKSDGSSVIKIYQDQ